MFCNLNVDFQIWNANPDVKPGPPCGMFLPDAPSKGLVVELRSMRSFQFDADQKTYLKIYTRGPIWSSFGSLVARNTFLISLAGSGISPRSCKHKSECNILEWFVTLSMFCNWNVHSSL